MAENNALSVPISEDDKKLAQKIKKRHTAGVSYKSAMGYYDEWAEYQRFWDSDQWPAATSETENYPRPVTNHFAEIIEMKTAGLTYELPDIYFERKKGSINQGVKIPVQPINPEDESFTITPEELLSVIKDELFYSNNIKAFVQNFTRSSALLGNGIGCSLWDNSIMGIGEGSFIGDIDTFEVDISSFFFGDVSEPNIQKQPYVTMTERKPRKQVQAEYEQYSNNVAYLKEETASAHAKTYDYEKISYSEEDSVELIHYWEKNYADYEVEIDGETVKRKECQIDYYVVCQEYVIREQKDFVKSKLYPFINFCWYPKRRSAYGKPESKDLINNQKELNRLQGIALLGAYKAGLPNIIYKEGFVKKEDIPVGPGGNVIKDETPPGQGWGIDYMQPPTIASYIPHLKDSMQHGMRDTSGVHEAWSGKAPSAHLNASAIMALQEAAGVRIKGIQDRLFDSLVELGRIWLGYIKQYYTEDRMYKVYGKNNVEGVAWFKPEDFKDLEFDVKVSASSASPFSKTVIASTLEGMLERGIIDGDLYMRMLPPEIFPKITTLIEMTEDRVAEQEQKVMEQQMLIVNQIVVQTIDQAREAGVPIAPETLQVMEQMIRDTASEQEV